MCDRSLRHRGFRKYHHVTTSRAFIWSPPKYPPSSCYPFNGVADGVLSVYSAKGLLWPVRNWPALGLVLGPTATIPSFPAETCLPPPIWKSHVIMQQVCLGVCEKVTKVEADCTSGLSFVTLGASPVARGCGRLLSPAPSAQSADRKRRSHTSAAIALVADRLRRTHGVICVQGCPRSDHGWARGTRLETPRWWVEGPVGTTHETKVGGVGSLVVWGPLNGGRVVPRSPPPPSPPRPASRCCRTGDIGFSLLVTFDWA